MIPGTINDDIEQGRELTKSHRVFNGSAVINYTKTGESIKIPMNSLVNRFRYLLDDFILTKELSGMAQQEYRYSPKKVSQDIYGTTQYWSILLYLNECHSIIDFEPIVLKYIDPTYIDDIINEIIILGGN